MGMGYNKSKFIFSETFNNSTGKTSGSGFIGVLMGLATIVGVITVFVGWWVGKPDVLEIFDKILQLGLLSAALLGVRKLSASLNPSSAKKNEGPPSEADAEAESAKI